MKLMASQRAIDKQLPFILIKIALATPWYKTYSSVIKRTSRKTIKYAFVTHNKTDFSSPTENKQTPSDISKYFDNVRSAYFFNLAEALKVIDPELITDLMIEQEVMRKRQNLSFRHLSCVG